MEHIMTSKNTKPAVYENLAKLTILYNDNTSSVSYWRTRADAINWINSYAQDDSVFGTHLVHVILRNGELQAE
jgi:hypothetical protein